MKKPFIVITTFIIVFFIIFVWWLQGTTPVNPNDPSEKIFVVEKGEGIRSIANKLKSENLIKDPVVFFLVVKKLNLDDKIQAGDFKISPSMTAQQVAQALTHGTLDIWITIPEGKRAEEIADILQEKIPNFQDSWRALLNKNEGYLFPDTYLIPRNADVAMVISIMRNNFEKKFTSIPNLGNALMTHEQIVIIASMVEREAKHDKDRPLVTSVILNRFDIDMALQIDATIQYALGYQPLQKTWWKKNLTSEDLIINSPYNTYKNIGLPPTPISNPGLSTLTAVVNPAKTQYLYYLSDTNGINHYAKTLTEHNANIKRYGL